MGGWSVVKSLRRSGNHEKGDARILGSRSFVKQVIDAADQHVRQQLTGNDSLQEAKHAIQVFCDAHNLPIEVLRGGSCRRAVSQARRRLTFKLVNEFGLSLAETGRQLGLTTSGVAQILRRKSL
jgi:hypothetical protein